MGYKTYSQHTTSVSPFSSLKLYEWEVAPCKNSWEVCSQEISENSTLLFFSWCHYCFPLCLDVILDCLHPLSPASRNFRHTMYSSCGTLLYIQKPWPSDNRLKSSKPCAEINVFFFLSWLCQIFCDRVGKLTNMYKDTQQLYLK